MPATTPGEPLSHWHKLIENFNTSAVEFYASVEQGIQARQVPDTTTSRIDYKESGVFSAKREYLRIKRGRYVFDICAAPFGTGFFFSWWLAEVGSSLGCLYLLGIVVGISALGFLFFVVLSTFIGFQNAAILSALGFPFALLFGVPLLFWILGVITKQEGLDDFVLRIPILGSLYERFFQPMTYYKLDTAQMFQDAIHSAVLEAVDALMSAKGIRALSETERKPILREFYRR
jgi:hypothetical protein